MRFCLAGGFAFLLDKTQTLSAIHADDGLVSWSLQMPQYRNMKKKKQPLLWTGPIMVNGHAGADQRFRRDRVRRRGCRAGSSPSRNCPAPPICTPIAAGGMLLQLTRDATLTAYR